MNTDAVDDTAIDLILIDGVCLSCHKIVRCIHKRDRRRVFYYATQQSLLGQNLLRKYHLKEWEGRSIVYLQKGRPYVLSNAVFAICSQLPSPWRWVALLRIVPCRVLDWLYLAYSRNRHRLFARLETCEVSEDALRERFLDSSEPFLD